MVNISGCITICLSICYMHNLVFCVSSRIRSFTPPHQTNVLINFNRLPQQYIPPQYTPPTAPAAAIHHGLVQYMSTPIQHAGVHYIPSLHTNHPSVHYVQGTTPSMNVATQHMLYPQQYIHHPATPVATPLIFNQQHTRPKILQWEGIGNTKKKKIIKRTIKKSERTHTVPKGCVDRTIKKITTRRRRKVNNIEVEGWTTVTEYYQVNPGGVLNRISEDEAQLCIGVNDDETLGSVEEDNDISSEIEDYAEPISKDKSIQQPNEKKAHIQRIPNIPPGDNYLDYSDHQNRGKRWCWKLLFPASMPHNFGYLVYYQECVTHRHSVYYQETDDASVCTNEGGIEIDFLPFEETSIPYKIACIPRIEALKADKESCWAIKTTLPNLVLERIDSTLTENDLCNKKYQPWPFYDKKHISSRFSTQSGGISKLYFCNRLGVKQASILYHMTPTGIISGFSDVFCDPPSPIPIYACVGVAVKCFYYLPPPTFFY